MLQIANFSELSTGIRQSYRSGGDVVSKYGHLTKQELLETREQLYSIPYHQRNEATTKAINELNIAIQLKDVEKPPPKPPSEQWINPKVEGKQREVRKALLNNTYVKPLSDMEGLLSELGYNSVEPSTDLQADTIVEPSTEPNRYRYSHFRITNLQKIWNKPNQKDLKQFAIYENPRLYRKPKSLFYSIVSFLKALQDSRDGKDTPTNSFIKEYAYDCDLEFYRHEIFKPPQILQKKVVDYWELYQIRNEAINYFSSYLYMSKEFDYDITNRYDTRHTTNKDVIVSMKQAHFDLPMNEFKVLAAFRSIIPSKSKKNPRPLRYSRTTYEFILARFFGFETLQDFREQRDQDKNLNKLYKEFSAKRHHRLKQIINSLQRKKLLATVFFRDLTPRNIYISVELREEELREKIISIEKNKSKIKNQTERITMKKEYAKPTWEVKDLTKGEKDQLIENLLTSHIQLADEVDELKQKLGSANDFLEIVINKLKFIDTKHRDVKELDTLIRNSITTVN